MSDDKHITIDGRQIPFEPGQTIMDAALAAKVYIPHLCHNPEFSPHGSCRVCSVRLGERMVAACATPAAPGQVIDSEAEDIREMRRQLLQMLFVEGNHVCPACEKSGACQLQAVAYYCEMLSPHFKHFFPKRPIDASHPDAIIDFDRCILCELCVRASRDVDQKNVFSVSGRGIDAHLTVNSPSGQLGDSDFDINDKSAQVCPTGAILPKHKGYEVPIGSRLYDQEPIDQVGDVAAAQSRKGGKP
ncbi:MAG: 2Fe-2S iron-sulfur cluster-binding protein [Pseudomonadota bacterium]|nr:2Fe-2S iron-sulfur cluster-binding protein [Pseudomonadota bacterium]